MNEVKYEKDTILVLFEANESRGDKLRVENRI